MEFKLCENGYITDSLQPKYGDCHTLSFEDYMKQTVVLNKCCINAVVIVRNPIVYHMLKITVQMTVMIYELHKILQFVLSDFQFYFNFHSFVES